jgi:hypothetical protein
MLHSTFSSVNFPLAEYLTEVICELKHEIVNNSKLQKYIFF